MDKTLFDAHGSPIAYIADDGERSIHLWNGQAVAYIDEQLNCHGWNGHYLGWIEDGILFDAQGRRIGFLKSNCPHANGTERSKSPKASKPPKRVKSSAPPRPAPSATTSSLSLSDLFKAGSLDSL